MSYKSLFRSSIPEMNAREKIAQTWHRGNLGFITHKKKLNKHTLNNIYFFYH